jgi:hypothetical protein
MALDNLISNSTLPAQTCLDPRIEDAAANGSSGAGDINTDQLQPGENGIAMFSPTAFSQPHQPVETVSIGGAPLNEVAPATLLASNSDSQSDCRSGNFEIHGRSQEQCKP